MDINIKGEYPSNMLSKMAPHEFSIDGVKCRSMESFLQSLKYSDADEQKEICALSGEEAAAAGSKNQLWKQTHEIWWRGKKIQRGSEEFARLISRAYTELAQNGDFAKALFDSGDADLRYSAGGQDNFESILTEEKFVLMLKVYKFFFTERTVRKLILLERCRKGDNEAMLELSKISDSELSNMWLVRAAIYGNVEAREILRKNPERASRTVFSFKNFVPGERTMWFDGSYKGETLMSVGFNDLPDSKGSYVVAGLSKERVIVIGMETGCDGSDEYGYGAETHYDYYVYDEFFTRISETVFKNDPDGAYGVGAEYIKSHNDLPDLRIDWLAEDEILKRRGN